MHILTRIYFSAEGFFGYHFDMLAISIKQSTTAFHRVDFGSK